jgi:ribosomal protein S18 acetylase RimI-like enzyme
LAARASTEPIVRIRPAAAADIPGIVACLVAAFAPYREQYAPAAFADTVPDAEGVRQRMQEMTVLVADDAGAIVGTLSCQAVGGGEGHLRGMAVLPERLGHGIADRLLAAAEAELRRMGCSRVTLDTTEPLQRAVRFYARHGYERTGRVSDFFGMPLFEYARRLG